MRAGPWSDAGRARLRRALPITPLTARARAARARLGHTLLAPLPSTTAHPPNDQLRALVRAPPPRPATTSFGTRNSRLMARADECDEGGQHVFRKEKESSTCSQSSDRLSWAGGHGKGSRAGGS